MLDKRAKGKKKPKTSYRYFIAYRFSHIVGFGARKHTKYEFGHLIWNVGTEIIDTKQLKVIIDHILKIEHLEKEITVALTSIIPLGENNV